MMKKTLICITLLLICALNVQSQNTQKTKPVFDSTTFVTSEITQIIYLFPRGKRSRFPLKSTHILNTDSTFTFKPINNQDIKIENIGKFLFDNTYWSKRDLMSFSKKYIEINYDETSKSLKVSSGLNNSFNQKMNTLLKLIPKNYIIYYLSENHSGIFIINRYSIINNSYLKWKNEEARRAVDNF